MLRRAAAAVAALALLVVLARAFAPPQPAAPTAPTAPPLVVLATVDGGVVALDAATGTRVFSLPASPAAPAVASWAAPGHPRYIPTLSGQLFRLPPDGAADPAPPEEVDSVFLSPDAAAAPGVADGADSSAIAPRDATARTNVPAAILRHTHTAVTYIDALTGKVVRELDFESPPEPPRSSAAGVPDGVLGPVILLSRTKVGVRVVDAVTGAELANASITHTTPSLLFGNLCVPAAEMTDVFSSEGDEDTSGVSVGSPAAFKTLVDARRGIVKMVAPGSSDVRWTADIEADILSAHGLGNVHVVQTSESTAIDGYEDGLADHGRAPGVVGVEDVDRPAQSDRAVIGDLTVRGRGLAKYAIRPRRGLGGRGRYPGLSKKAPRSPPSQALPPPSSIADGHGYPEDKLGPPYVSPSPWPEYSQEPQRVTSRDWRSRLLRVLRKDDQLGFSTWDDAVRRPEGGSFVGRNFGRGSDRPDDLGALDMPRNVLVGLSVALGVILGVAGLAIARRVRSRRLHETSEGSSVPAIGSRGYESATDRPEEREASTGSNTSASAVPVRSDSGWMTIGCFQVSSKVLGVGSHGTVVYEGRMMPGARRIAVKRLLRQFYESARQEISLLVELDEASPHVVRYFAMEEDAEFIYLALELCTGSLADRVAKHVSPAPPKSYTRGPLPRATCKALRQLMQGLADLHRLEIVHRDLKPHNVLCQGVNLKLADVGLALRLDEGRSSFSVVANAAGGVGTTGWRAPEVLNGQRQTRSVDVFSLGCIISFVVTGGDHPFGSEIFGRDGRIATGKPDLRSLAALQAPEALDIVERMLARNPVDRPTAAGALAHPFFWNDATKLAFLVDISDRLYDLRHDLIRYTELLDESPIAMRHCSDWPSRLEPEVMREIGTGYISSASNLLRIIRNKKNHYSELSPRLQKLFGPLPEDDDSNSGTSNVDLGNVLDEQNFLTYFLRRVPQLLMCVYAHALAYPELVRQSHFSRYGFKKVTKVAGLAAARNRREREDNPGCFKGASSDVEHVPPEKEARHYYARGKLVATSESAAAPCESLVSSLQENGVHSPGAGERWRFRLTTGLYNIPAEEGLDEEDTEVPVSPMDVSMSPSPGTPAMTLQAPPGFAENIFSLSPSQAGSRFDPGPRASVPPGFENNPPRPRGFGSDVLRQGPVSHAWYGAHRQAQPPPRTHGPPNLQTRGVDAVHSSLTQQAGHEQRPQQSSQRPWPERKPTLGYSEPGASDDRDWSGLRRGS